MKLTLSNMLGEEGKRLDAALASKGDSPVLRGLGTPENTLRFMKACLRGSYLFGRHLVPSYVAHAFTWLTTQGPVDDNMGPVLRKVVELCIGELCTNNIYNRDWQCHAHWHDLWEAYVETAGDVACNEFAKFNNDAHGYSTICAIENNRNLWSPGSARYAGQLLICCDDPLATFIVMTCNEMLTTIIYPVALKYLCTDAKFDKFRRFLEVHVQLDGDDHGYAALEWLELYLLKKHLPEQRVQSATSMVRALYERD